MHTHINIHLPYYSYMFRCAMHHLQGELLVFLIKTTCFFYSVALGDLLYRIYRMRINYRRISLRHNFRPDSVWFLPVGFRPTTSKDTTRIARAHQHRNRERHTRHVWEGLAGMGVSPGHLPCHTIGAHRMHLRSLWNCKHSSFKW